MAGKPQRYSMNESFRRLSLLMRDKDISDDTPEKYAGDFAWDESLSDIVELAQNSYPGVTGVIPYGLNLQESHFEGGAHAAIHQAGLGPQRIGTGDNYTGFNASGTLEFRGAATIF